MNGRTHNIDTTVAALSIQWSNSAAKSDKFWRDKPCQWIDLECVKDNRVNDMIETVARNK